MYGERPTLFWSPIGGHHLKPGNPDLQLRGRGKGLVTINDLYGALTAHFPDATQPGSVADKTAAVVEESHARITDFFKARRFLLERFKARSAPYFGIDSPIEDSNPDENARTEPSWRTEFGAETIWDAEYRLQRLVSKLYGDNPRVVSPGLIVTAIITDLIIDAMPRAK